MTLGIITITTSFNRALISLTPPAGIDLSKIEKESVEVGWKYFLTLKQLQPYGRMIS